MRLETLLQKLHLVSRPDQAQEKSAQKTKAEIAMANARSSFRLAYALSHSKFRDTIRSLGIDIVPAMLEFAAEKCQHPSWRFELSAGLKIPEADETADMVCFTSVFTHLLQEESFIYLQEAQRVLKAGGKIVASYLDITAPKHWDIFEANVNSARARQSKPMDIFLAGFPQGLGREVKFANCGGPGAHVRSTSLHSAKELSAASVAILDAGVG